MSVIYKKEVEEFNISVPWGHIAVKAWGHKDDPHVLLIHGTSDNLGTFDNLMPYLINGYYYICIDLPSHGKSSHFPPHLPIHTSNYLIACKLVVKYFKKEKYIYIGHSLGGQIGFLFTQLYPQYIEKFISLDAIPLFFPIEVKQFKDYMRQQVDKNIDLQEKFVTKKAPTYSYEDILEKFRKNRYQGEILTKEAAEPMLKRIINLTDDGKYTLSTDQRIKAVIDPLNDTQYKILSVKNDPVTCPVLIIFAKQNTYPRKKYNLLFKDFIKLKNVNVIYVDGKHDVHNNNPELVYKHINMFLLKSQAKL